MIEGINLLKNDKTEHKTLFLSHCPEIMKLSGKYQIPELIGNYIKFKLSLLDSIQIFSLKYLYDICVNYKWKKDHVRIDSLLNEIFNSNDLPCKNNVLNQTIYVPLLEVLRHFDGYSHVQIDKKYFPLMTFIMVMISKKKIK